MPENPRSRKKSFYTVQRASRAAASSARVILRVILAFVGITATLVLIGVAYTHFGWRRLDFRTIPSWFLRLSNEQWLALLGGTLVAFVMIVIPCARITGRKVAYDPDAPAPSPRRIVRTLTVFAVLFLYVAGLSSAYYVSLALGHSRDWAIIHSLYSWVYVGYSFSGWIAAHRKQPLGKTLHEFVKMMGM
ncbi:MAG TPA: hypothetical protein VEV17_11325 [Bryobacteraceae bacterium]|nr:hypothetical protein [Bryobacteraceae bacterium]